MCFYVKAGSRPNSILDQSFELVVVTKIQWDFGRIENNYKNKIINCLSCYVVPGSAGTVVDDLRYDPDALFFSARNF